MFVTVVSGGVKVRSQKGSVCVCVGQGIRQGVRVCIYVLQRHTIGDDNVEFPFFILRREAVHATP